MELIFSENFLLKYNWFSEYSMHAHSLYYYIMFSVGRTSTMPGGDQSLWRQPHRLVLVVFQRRRRWHVIRHDVFVLTPTALLCRRRVHAAEAHSGHVGVVRPEGEADVGQRPAGERHLLHGPVSWFPMVWRGERIDFSVG